MMTTLSMLRNSFTLTVIVFALFLTGCQPKIYLMPTPVVLQSGEIDAYAKIHPDKDTNIVNVFYATNRWPVAAKGYLHYSTGFTRTLSLGQAAIGIGDSENSWDLLKAFSTTRERDQELKLTLERTLELGKVKSDQDIGPLSETNQIFVAAINQALQENESKDITIYIHGATADFYTATAQAAQVRHFTGYSQVILAFSWPSAENFLFYGTDVQNALATAPLFTRLLKFLAQHTQTEQINILAYSAGSLVASHGLSQLGKSVSRLDTETARKKLRLGEVYFAAPDVGLEEFVELLPDFTPLTNATTIALNPNDFVLNISRIYQHIPRAGKPEENVLSEQQEQWLARASHDGSLNVIRILPDLLSGHDPGAHDFWYSHPWVSTDVLIQMLFHTSPSSRGLVAGHTEDFKWWYFPQDYPNKIVTILKELELQAKNSQLPR